MSKTCKPQNGPRKTSPSLANWFIFGQWISNLSRTWMVSKQFLKQLHVLSEGSAKHLEELVQICRCFVSWCFLEIIEISSSLVHKLTGIFGTGHDGKVEQTTLAIRPSLVLLHRNSPQKKNAQGMDIWIYLAFCPTNHHSKKMGQLQQFQCHLTS